MNRMIVGNAIMASLAMAIGFYSGTLWHWANSGEAQPAATATAAISTYSVESAPPSVGSEANITVSTQIIRSHETASRQHPLRPEQTTRKVKQAEKANREGMLGSEQVVSGFDRNKLEETYRYIHSQDANLRHQALRTLTQLGADEVKQDLVRAASNEVEMSEVRQDLIQEIDWSGNTQELTDILMRSRDSEARLAAVTAVSTSKLTEAERLNMENVIMENFAMEPEDGIKIATLNYFLSTDPIAFQRIINEYPNEISSPEVQSYLKRISTPPDQSPQTPLVIEGSGG